MSLFSFFLLSVYDYTRLVLHQLVVSLLLINSLAAINVGVAGCCTGLALSFPGKPSQNHYAHCLFCFVAFHTDIERELTDPYMVCVPGAPQAMLQSCLTFGAFSFILEGLNKRQAALAHSVSLRHQTGEFQDLHRPLPLSLALPIHEEIKGAFSSFCKSLAKPKKI